MEIKDNDSGLYPKTGCGRGFTEAAGVASNRIYKDVDGIVETPQGFVIVRSAYFEGSYRMSSLEIIKNGRLYYRHIDNKNYMRNMLVTKAKEFAIEIYEEGL